jgi:hypothetical protein
MSGHREQIGEFLRRFGKERDLELDPLNAEGYSEIARGSATIGIHFLAEKDVLVLLAPIMPVPARDAEALFRRLLELSFLATGDAAFAIDKKTETVYLRILRRAAGLDYEEFEDLLETIASVADDWDDQLKQQFGGS